MRSSVGILDIPGPPLSLSPSLSLSPAALHVYCTKMDRCWLCVGAPGRLGYRCSRAIRQAQCVELSLSLSPSKLVCTDSAIRYTYIPDCCTVLYPPPPPPPPSLFVNLSCINQSQPHECCSDKDRLQDSASAEIQFQSFADFAPIRSGVLRAHKLRTHQNLPAQ